MGSILVAFLVLGIAGLLIVKILAWLVGGIDSATDQTGYRPPVPRGTAIEAWSARLSPTEVAGENYYESSFKKLFGDAAGFSTPEGAELNHPADLSCAPDNPYDANAVAVFVDGHHLGYLARETAAKYRCLGTLDGHLRVPSRQWARTDGRRVFARVTVWLPDPAGISPLNPLPPNACVIPGGSTIQVTGEEHCMDVLKPLLRKADGGTFAATLHEATIQRARSTAQRIEVRIDGQAIGVLTATQTDNLLPLVRHIADRGRVPTVRATMKGNHLKADVTLHSLKASEVDDEWLSQQFA